VTIVYDTQNYWAYGLCPSSGILITAAATIAESIIVILFSDAVQDRLCGLVVRVLGFRSGGLGSIPGTTRKKKVVGLERGPLSLVSTIEELLDRKVAVPV
jgi:hypothetical protein